MKMIAVGDNVTDCYLDQKIYYPGGNAVNVAVNCKRDGFETAAYIGIFGSDENAAHLHFALEQEQISTAHCRTICAISGRPGVKLDAHGDRRFVGGPKDTAQHIVRLRLTPEDLAYIEGFDLCHTSCFSSIEPELAKLKGSCQISFDFSEMRQDSYLQTVCPHVRFAFFSGSELSEQEVYALMDRCHALGTELVCVTRGTLGAILSQNGTRYSQGICKTEVVDTMGAGDSFIAGFLTAFTRGDPVQDALAFAAQCAAKTCTFYGGFGYPHPFADE